jgi:hypothetical protein
VSGVVIRWEGLGIRCWKGKSGEIRFTPFTVLLGMQCPCGGVEPLLYQGFLVGIYRGSDVGVSPG